MLAKPLIYVVLFVLGITIIFSSSSTDILVQGKPVAGMDINCDITDENAEQCCWYEDMRFVYPRFALVYVCQVCLTETPQGYTDCGPVTEPGTKEQPPTPPPTGGKGIFGSNVLPTQSISPDDGSIVEQPPPTLTPTSPTESTEPPSPPTPPIGGISEQPPFFGRNVGKVPLGILQEPETPPMFGQVAPQGQLQPPATTLGGGEGKEGGQDTQSRTISPTGYCAPFIKTTCVPCDPGLPGANCVLQSEWPPASTTGEDIPQAQLPSEEEEEEEEQPPGALPRPPAAGIDPEAEIAPDDEGTQPQT